MPINDMLPGLRLQIDAVAAQIRDAEQAIQLLRDTGHDVTNDIRALGALKARHAAWEAALQARGH